MASNDLQMLSTLNWPGSYPANQECYWIIKPDRDNDLEITLNQGEIDSESDFVEVRKHFLIFFKYCVMFSHAFVITTDDNAFYYLVQYIEIH